MVLCVLVKVENSHPFSLIQYTANKLYIIFPQQVLSWLFLFLIFDFQREIIGHKAFWRKGENQKKKSENEYFPAGQNISELVLYLQRITKELQNRMLTSPLSAWLPVLWAYRFPICKMRIEIRPHHSQLKPFVFSHAFTQPIEHQVLYSAMMIPIFMEKNKTKQTLHLETNISEILKYHDLGLEIL